MHSVAPNGFHALNEEHGGKAAASDLVRDVPVGFLDADDRELLGQVGVATVPFLELSHLDSIHSPRPAQQNRFLA